MTLWGVRVGVATVRTVCVDFPAKTGTQLRLRFLQADASFVGEAFSSSTAFDFAANTINIFPFGSFRKPL